jgi:hypothetical protein
MMRDDRITLLTTYHVLPDSLGQGRAGTAVCPVRLLGARATEARGAPVLVLRCCISFVYILYVY